MMTPKQIHELLTAEIDPEAMDQLTDMDDGWKVHMFLMCVVVNRRRAREREILNAVQRAAGREDLILPN